MSNKEAKPGLRAEMGNGYLSLLDSVRHSFEQAAWGRETSGSLADDFYRWARPPEIAAAARETAELSGGIHGMTPQDRERRSLEAWIDGKHEPNAQRDAPAERERDEPELGE